MNKKIKTVLLGATLFSAIGVTGCAPTNDPNSGNASIVDDGATYVLKNNNLSLSFAKDNGSILSFKNIKTETDFIESTVGGNWAMMIDISTNNPFLSNPTGANTHLVTSRGQSVTFNTENDENGATITLTYDVSFNVNSKLYDGITVIQTASLSNNDDKISFNYEIFNNLNPSVIVSFTGAQLSGVKAGSDDYTLFWPYKEGKLYEEAVDMVKTATDASARMQMCYPSPASMQLIQLYNQNESLFYYVKDDTREYKEFNFGCFINNKQYDYQGVSAVDKVSMSATQYPFIRGGENKMLSETVIGCSSFGDYYTGANYYREFLEEKMMRNHTDYVKNWTGFSVLIGSYYGDKHFASYTQAEGFTTNYSAWASMTNQYGINSTTLIGWHKGGFDSSYPDYEFIDGPGFGQDGFVSMTNKVHNDGNKVFPYINAHIADRQSKWSNTIFDNANGISNMERAAIKTKGFNNSLPQNQFIDYMIMETYGTATTYYAMCPASTLFQDAIKNAVARLRSSGADGIWFDQLMEMPANLCFDETHGHATPATAYGEGYPSLLTEVDNIMRTLGNDDYLFASEGVCDAWIEFIDVCGYMWGRKLGARDLAGDGVNMVPQMTRYTMPAKFLGIEGAGTTSGSDDEFALAFVMSDPFLADPYKPSVGALTSLYAQNSTYLNGRYYDMCGTKVSDENIIYGLTVNDDKTQIIVNLYNYNLEESIGATLEIDLSRVGVSGNVKRVSNMRTGDLVSINNNVITLPNMEISGIASILIEIE